MGGVLRIGGGSKSNNETKNVDARVVGGDGSTNASVTGDGSSVTNTMTDLGAISGALDLAKVGIEGAYKIAGQSQAASGSLLTGALSMAGQQNEQFASTLEKVKTSDVRVLVIAGLAVVALGAVYMVKKG